MGGIGCCRSHAACAGGGFSAPVLAFEGEFVGQPGIDAALQRMNSGNAFSLQQERHPGAGRFVGSRAVEHDVAIARNFLMTLLKLLHRHAQSAGDGARLCFDIERLAQIDNHDRLARAQLVH